ncbi:Dihydroorotate dehydrogenase (quinone), mitochondrial [Zancudomyces culisetae]|uniref:Dihydroorotate dehydrogenase (quinone), mitochondrial n=1 Tax=Zancudomyces culisetae TaxID=1213189 RepID=A0A1R1PYK3_ZANCU|nr:Dihydroorotate dehydrogenase (quinone), mitochondrial [Zancudomyces culisetae]OMH86042.1 Dihydroorotate dehydrogenase (quinone), mitochondrial [Zancudomyces culisetae]|eukprot:OMH81197.1 Dihydroorotate dehydrogenase (quinone), mitochondrial [Zancudomyces culisetae]
MNFQTVRGATTHLLGGAKRGFYLKASRSYSAGARSNLGTKASNAMYGLFGIVGLGALGFYCSDSRAAVHKYVSTPLLGMFDEEVAHDLSIKALSLGLCPIDKSIDDKKLEIEIFGKKMSNPIGMAAGYDKNAKVADQLFGLGFGAVEVGSITPLPQVGNPKKRLFRLPNSEAIINRMGLNNDGVAVVKERLKARLWRHVTKTENPEKTAMQAYSEVSRSGKEGRILGINISKNHSSDHESPADFLVGIKELGTLADYLVINISCPNVKNLGAGSDISIMRDTLKSAREECNALGAKQPALLVKIGPDYSDEELAVISKVALECRVDGIITSNTSRSRPASISQDHPNCEEMGGLSGTPIKQLALNTTRKVYKFTEGKIPIIGCGGISTAEDVYEFGKAGASFVQVYTAMIYQGPGLVANLKQDLSSLLGDKKWSEIVGSSVE